MVSCLVEAVGSERPLRAAEKHDLFKSWGQGVTLLSFTCWIIPGCWRLRVER